jgi:hypothetical protein
LILQPVLAICIPTFKRTNEIIKNLEKMNFLDSRVIFIVSSNCPDKILFDYCSGRSDIYYYQTAENKGFAENLFAVLSLPIAQFSLILSDEDFVDSNHLNDLIEFLECSSSLDMQYLVPTNDYFSLSSMKRLIGKSELSYLDIMLTNPHIPTYMSGFVYPAQKVSELISKFPRNPQNAYPFLLLRNFLLEAGGKLQILPFTAIKRGPDSMSRDPEGNFVDDAIGIARTNYFLSHYRYRNSHKFFLEFWVASLILAQSLPGIKNGYVSFRLYRDGNRRYLGLEHILDSSFKSKLSKFLAEVVVFLSHVYRRIFIT